MVRLDKYDGSCNAVDKSMIHLAEYVFQIKQNI